MCICYQVHCIGGSIHGTWVFRSTGGCSELSNISIHKVILISLATVVTDQFVPRRGHQGPLLTDSSHFLSDQGLNVASMEHYYIDNIMPCMESRRQISDLSDFSLPRQLPKPPTNWFWGLGRVGQKEELRSAQFGSRCRISYFPFQHNSKAASVILELHWSLWHGMQYCGPGRSN